MVRRHAASDYADEREEEEQWDGVFRRVCLAGGAVGVSGVAAEEGGEEAGVWDGELLLE